MTKKELVKTGRSEDWNRNNAYIFMASQLPVVSVSYGTVLEV